MWLAHVTGTCDWHVWHMCISFLLRHWVPRGQPELVSSYAAFHPSGQLHQWGRLHPVKKGRWLSPSAQLGTLGRFKVSFGHTQHFQDIWNGNVFKRWRGKQNLFYGGKSGRPLNVQVSKKLAMVTICQTLSNLINILTFHGPSFRSWGKRAANLWLNMTEGQTEPKSKGMNIILQCIYAKYI